MNDAANIPDAGPQSEGAAQAVEQTTPDTGAAQAEHDPFAGAMVALGLDEYEAEALPQQPEPEAAPPAADADEQGQADDAGDAGDTAAADAGQQPVVVEPDGKIKIVDPESAVLIDPDGNEVLARDVIWRTQQYHRKLAEKDREVRETLSKVEQLDAELATDPAGLARKIIAVADPAQRVAAAAEVLRDTGLHDLAEQVNAAMAQAGLQYDPLAAERARIERERAELDRVKQQQAVQARLDAELQALTSELGRDVTEREWETIAEVAEAHNLRYPDRPLTLKEAYDKAARLLRIEEAERRAAGASAAKVKPAEAVTTVEAAAPAPAPQQGAGRAVDYIDGALAALGID